MKHTHKHKLKYINLFENYTNDGVKIPYSRIDRYGNLNIKFPESATSVPPELNQLTTEVTGYLLIEDNTALETVTGFNQLQSVGSSLYIMNNTELQSVTEFNQLQSVGNSLWIDGNPFLETVTGFNQLQSVGGSLWIEGNTALQSVTGFNQLQSIGDSLCIQNNPNLVSLSIPSTIIKSVNYKYWYIRFEDKHRFESPEAFVNSELVIQDCIDKFNPGLHGDIVVTQILENIETWGTPETQATIINHLLSKGNYLEDIPENLKHLVEDTYKHLYHPDFNNTGAKSVAKVATGVTYGLF